MYDVAVTGHTPEKLGLDPQDENAMRKLAHLVPLIKSAITCQVIGTEPATFYLGMAQGFDLLAGAAVMQLKNEGQPLAIVCLYPYKNFGKFWSDRLARAWQQKIQAAAREVILCCDGVPANQQEAKMLLDERNSKIVVEAIKGNNSRMLSCYSGRPSGSGRTQAKFEKHGDPLHVTNVWEAIADGLSIRMTV